MAGAQYSGDSIEEEKVCLACWINGADGEASLCYASRSNHEENVKELLDEFYTRYVEERGSLLRSDTNWLPCHSFNVNENRDKENRDAAADK